jgi:hypothetical protein
MHLIVEMDRQRHTRRTARYLPADAGLYGQSKPELPSPDIALRSRIMFWPQEVDLRHEEAENQVEMSYETWKVKEL